MSWRELARGEEALAIAYVSKVPEINLFISGDLRSFGIDGKHVRARIYEKEGALAGILLRYMDRNYVFYTAEKDFPFQDIADLIKSENPTLEGVCLSGKAEIIAPVQPFLKPLTLENTMMARANAASFKKVSAATYAGLRLLGSKEDFEALEELQSTIQEFSSSKRSRQEVVDGFLAAHHRGALAYGVYVNGLLVSAASTTADTKESSMLVGVCTREGYRNKGYASLVVSQLLKACFARGESFVCLFYDNPLAGKIYHSFGFKDIAPYAMLH